MSGDRETGFLEPRQGKACWQKEGREKETPRRKRGIGFTYHVEYLTLMQTCGLLNQGSPYGGFIDLPAAYIPASRVAWLWW